LNSFEANSWQGVFAPAGTPPELVNRLNAEFAKALASADIKDYFGSQGFIVGGSSPEKFRTFIATEIAKWAKVVKAANVTVG
jgi:tripartite-type tricarboxylate transporter receptor subunit TctC